MMITATAVASWGSNRLDIFGLGLDNQMFHKAWDGQAWFPSPTDWEPLGGAFNSPPAVASWGSNRLDIFGLGLDNQMFHKAWDGQAWFPSPTGWEPLGGVFNPSPRPLPPTELHFDVNSIVFDGGVPVGGFSHLTLRQDGTYSFSGHFHDSGATEFNVSLVWAVKDSRNVVYTFQHAGHVAGTFESGSRDDDWSTDGQNDAIAQHWTDLARGANATLKASANLDLVNLSNSVIGSLGLVLGVIGIVVAV